MKRIQDLCELVQPLGKFFTAPSRDLFNSLLEGWILCPCRRAVTSLYHFADPDRIHAHDAYHRFFRASAWTRSKLFQALAEMLVKRFSPGNVLHLLGDDTVHKKTGRKVAGAKYCRDAVRSTAKKLVLAWGLQVVVLCIEVQPPWGGEPLALPINLRVYKKRATDDNGKSILDLMREMIQEVMKWFPDKIIYFVGDGFYAPLAADASPTFHVISRMRYDAALYCLPKKPLLGEKGRRKVRGDRLPNPEQIAAKARNWKSIVTIERGEKKTRLVHVRRVVWDKVLRGRYIQLVISRDPSGREKDDYFFTTDTTLDPDMVIARYADRWAIEDTFRNGKQYLGIEEPQSWKKSGPEKVAIMGYAVYSFVWAWFIQLGNYLSFPDRPWFQEKSKPSFQDALAELRHQIWDGRISECVLDNPQLKKFTETLIESLSRAA